jgi:hypothetical protein
MLPHRCHIDSQNPLLRYFSKPFFDCFSNTIYYGISGHLRFTRDTLEAINFYIIIKIFIICFFINFFIKNLHICILILFYYFKYLKEENKLLNYFIQNILYFILSPIFYLTNFYLQFI